MFLGLIVASAALIVMIVVGLAWGGVSRGQVARFARRQHLEVTPANGQQVIRYLAHTRRWRAAGVIAGVISSIAAGLPDGHVSVNFIALFAGWFIGALAAEVRMARGPVGARRVASLRPRTFRRYVGQPTWLLLPASLAVAVTVAAASIPSGHAVRQVVTLALALATTVVTMIIRNRVVSRGQRYLPPDQLAADEAIRSRSLHVLCGGGAALVLMCVANQIASPGLGTVVTFAAAILGWSVGTSRFAVPASPPAPVTV